MSSFNINGNLCNHYQTTANEFNKYFSTTANNILCNNSRTESNENKINQSLKYLYKVFKCPFTNLILTPVNNIEIINISNSLKNKKSYGYDEIPVPILKQSIPFIISPLTFIINKSLTSGVFPSSLKYSQINPIFKKSDKSDMSNYRTDFTFDIIFKIFLKIHL
jgi:hypothetical protein